MYGYFLRCLAEMVEKRYGRDSWLQICEYSKANIIAGHVLVHRQYSEEETSSLINEATVILGINRDDLLEETGVFFFEYLMNSGYEKFLRALGNTLHDFLSNLDLVYHHLDPFYPDMSAPLFRCAPSSEGGLLLTYFSERSAALKSFVIGIVRTVAQELFHVDIQMDKIEITAEAVSNPGGITHEKDMPSSDPVQAFIIKDKRALSLGCGKKRSLSFISNFSKLRISSSPKDLSLSCNTLCHLFPYHFVLNRDLHFIQIGKKMSELIQRNGLNVSSQLRFQDVLSIQKPLVSLTFSSILSNMNTLFALRLKENDMESPYQQQALEDTLCFRGQVVYIPESDCILFMCSPRAHDISKLKQMRLFLTDIPQYDVTRDLFLVSQSRRHGRELVRKLEETSSDLLKMQEKLQRERKQTDKLLFSMLPEHIAHELRINRRVNAERFDVVTVLCSDIVNFTALCGHEKVVPMDIIRVLNKLYTNFDALTSIHGVFKVETIGDAYLIVGGVPEYSTDHADKVITMAFDMIEVCKMVISPADGQPIQIRLGVHSGECVAGVVGEKKPRYCLFGQTVSRASQMEALSLPNQINVTAATRRCLVYPSNYVFESNSKDTSLQSYFIRQNQENVRCNIALGFPTSKGMFKTPNPTPPSSHDSSPATSPLWVDRITTFSSNILRESGPTLTVPNVRAPTSSRLQTSFNFDFGQITVNVPPTVNKAHSSASLANSKGTTKVETTKKENKISINIDDWTSKQDRALEIVHNKQAQEDGKEKQEDKKDSAAGLQRPRQLLEKQGTKFEINAKPHCNQCTISKNGLLRRNSDIPKLLENKDAKLIYYFRACQSTPPTPHNS